MNRFISKIGEVNYNNFGSKMIIKEYRTSKDIDVYFPLYEWCFNHTTYGNFKKGQIKCPYEPRTYGKGYMGEGEYKTKEDGKFTNYYQIWIGMMSRCYNVKRKERLITYEKCEVEDYLLNFQNACKFFDSIYYEVPNEEMELDKDILIKGNKIYSRETCIFVPKRINSLFTKHDSLRGEYPIGVSINKDKFMSRCNDKNCNPVYLGCYNTPEEAFQAYKEYKEKVIKEVANEYKSYIPDKLYQAMYNYEVEITD